MKFQITKQDINNMVMECVRKVMLREDDEDMDYAIEVYKYFKSMDLEDEDIDDALQDKFGIGLDEVLAEIEARENADNSQENGEGNETPIKGRRKRVIEEYRPSEEMLEKLNEVGIEEDVFEHKNALIEKLHERFHYFRREAPDKEKLNIVMSLLRELGV